MADWRIREQLQRDKETLEEARDNTAPQLPHSSVRGGVARLVRRDLDRLDDDVAYEKMLQIFNSNDDELKRLLEFSRSKIAERLRRHLALGSQAITRP